MNQEDRPSQEDKQKDNSVQAAGKKPYHKPEFRYERTFETMALACGKLSPTERQCRFNRKRS